MYRTSEHSRKSVKMRSRDWFTKENLIAQKKIKINHHNRERVEYLKNIIFRK